MRQKHSSCEEPMIQIVDDTDNPVGGASKLEVISRGLVHRSARVMLQDERGRVLLQKRVTTGPVFPGRWDNSAAGFVDVGESPRETAERELEEELGITAELGVLACYRAFWEGSGVQLDRFMTLFVGKVPSSTEFKLQPDEVAGVRWCEPSELVRLCREHPEQVTDGLAGAAERLYVDH